MPESNIKNNDTQLSSDKSLDATKVSVTQKIDITQVFDPNSINFKEKNRSIKLFR